MVRYLCLDNSVFSVWLFFLFFVFFCFLIFCHSFGYCRVDSLKGLRELENIASWYFYQIFFVWSLNGKSNATCSDLEKNLDKDMSMLWTSLHKNRLNDVNRIPFTKINMKNGHMTRNRLGITSWEGDILVKSNLMNDEFFAFFFFGK